MKKYILLIALCIFSFNAIHADIITWTLSDDGTLTISGTYMPGYTNNGYPWDSQYYKEHKEHKEIKQVIIKNGVKNIGGYAFKGCSSLTSIYIPNSVTSIGDEAFSGCSSLKSITIPNSVTNIGDEAFSGCRGLTSITIPNSVTNIGDGAFEGCSGLTSITIPNSVANIGDGAFEGCSGLTSITIPNSVANIGNNAFYGCSSLTSAIIGNSVTSIGEGAFSGCSGLASVTIPNSVTSIGEGAFSGCSGLASVTIPNSVTIIGDYAFYGCSGLASVTIPNSVTSIGENTFQGTPWYDNQPDGLVYAGLVLYKYKGKMPANAHIVIKEGTKGIASNAFNGYSSLSNITIPNSVTSIGGGAFDGTPWYNSQPRGLVYAGLVLYKYKGKMPVGTTHIDIKEGTTEIASNAFEGCSTLKSITIPNSVTNIGDKAFYGCSYLKSITIPNSATSIGEEAFCNCSDLTSIIIPNSVTSIGYGAFYNCSDLTSIIIPNSVTSIGARTFYGCSRLTSITLPNSATSIGDEAFYNCSDLTSIIIPNSVTSIGYEIFAGCSGLNSVTIGNSVTSFGDATFEGCYNIKEIYSWSILPPEVYRWSEHEDWIVRDINTQHAKLFVPEGAAETYSYVSYWKEFAHIYEMSYTPILSEANPIAISDSKPTITKGYYQENTMTYVREGYAIHKDNYASFCLPFAVDPTDAQFKAVYVPVGMALYNTEANTLRLGFYKSDDIIPAGTPFLALLAVNNKVEIKNALPVNYDANGPSVKNQVVRTFNYSDVSGIMNENNDYSINFSGTYEQIYPTSAYTFNVNGSVGASANVVPFRAYVVLNKNTTNAKIIASFDDDADTTGIRELLISNDKLPVYDLNGRVVNEKSLKSGIYIKNGKKYVK